MVAPILTLKILDEIHKNKMNMKNKMQKYISRKNQINHSDQEFE